MDTSWFIVTLATTWVFISLCEPTLLMSPSRGLWPFVYNPNIFHSCFSKNKVILKTCSPLLLSFNKQSNRYSQPKLNQNDLITMRCLYIGLHSRLTVNIRVIPKNETISSIAHAHAYNFLNFLETYTTYEDPKELSSRSVACIYGYATMPGYSS